MKYLICVLLLAANANALPYFRPIDPAHPQKFAGFSIDPISTGKTSAISEVALITHSTADGCLLPSIVCEDWTPLAIGPSYNAGRFAFVFGPVVNLAPAARAALLAALQTISPETAFKASQAFTGKEGVTLAFGPQLWINPFRSGVFLPLNAWEPAGRIFVGAALKF